MRYKLVLQVAEFNVGSAIQLGEGLHPVKLLALIIAVERAFTNGLKATAEAVSFVGLSHFFHRGETSVGNVQKGVFFRAVQRHFIGAAATIIDKFDLDFLANAFQITE